MRIEKLVGALVLGGVVTACAPVAAPNVPGRDVGPPCREACPDVGPVVVRDDAGRDSGPLPDGGPFDASSRDSGRDGGIPIAITLDGVIDEAVWPDPDLLEVAPGPVFDGNHLDNLQYFRDELWLYIGFEGELVDGDRIVFYVDLGETTSDVNLVGFGLFDTVGSVDTMLSTPITGNTGFQPELGWGTAAMPNPSSSGNEGFGWRRLSSTGSFSLITTGSRQVCSPTACETAILLESIGATVDSPLQFVVRLGQPDYGWSNQTFPDSDRGSPEFISDLVVTVPEADVF